MWHISWNLHKDKLNCALITNINISSGFPVAKLKSFAGPFETLIKENGLAVRRQLGYDM